MEPLTLAGVSDDRSRLLLVSDRGAEFALAITPALRAALRGDATRLGQLEIKMDSDLRPRDIQARIRAGETPEAVAEAAHTTVEAIMAFVAPVLAERAHVADRAQRSSVRRPAGESGHSRTLGDAVEAHLRSCNVDPKVVEWDAWRREDGRWALTGAFTTTARSGSARFTFDTRGNFVVLDDDDARWLVGEAVASPAPARDDLQPARQRRLSSVPQDELPLGDDAMELVAEPPLDPPVQDQLDDQLDDQPDDQLDGQLALDDVEVGPDAPDAADVDAPPAPDPEPEPEEAPTRRVVQKKKGRASVPSWDEIMFGGGDQ